MWLGGRASQAGERTEPMLIRELSRATSVPGKTIRYYESVGLLPLPPRARNNYRQYSVADAERLRFIASARCLGVGIANLREIVAARDHGLAPCERLLEALDQCRLEIDHQLADMLALRETLLQLRLDGASLPMNDVDGRACVCSLVRAYGQTSDPAVRS